MLATQRHSSRSGFTLVELLVAASLTILIMAILGTAFQLSLGTLSQLKSAGDLADRLRSAENVIRKDLESAHFPAGQIDSAGDSPGKLRISDLTGGLKPPGGYFKITGGAGISEGFDADGFNSTRAVDNTLAMTIVRTGNNPSDFFSDNASSSRFGEVLWTLSANPSKIGGVDTYTLYRYQKLYADATQFAATANGERLTRLPVAQSDGAIVLTNVVSFEVKPTWQGGAAPRSNIPGGFNGDYPFDNVPNGSFDTNAPNGIRINGVMIKIRLFDGKNRQTRQSSIVVQL